MALIGAERYQKKLEGIGKAAEAKKLWTAIGFQAIDIIIQRTLKGKDYRGRPFTAYSKKYEARKKARGGEFFSGVNLHDKGFMFGSLKPKATPRNVTLFFSKTSEAKKATIHKEGLGPMPRREFFDLSPMERQKLGQLAAKRLRRIANG